MPKALLCFEVLGFVALLAKQTCLRLLQVPPCLSNLGIHLCASFSLAVKMASQYCPPLQNTLIFAKAKCLTDISSSSSSINDSICITMRRTSNQISTPCTFMAGTAPWHLTPMRVTQHSHHHLPQCKVCLTTLCVSLLPDSTVRLYFPKFSISGSYEITHVLSKMGIVDVFTDQADLSGITGAPELKVSKVSLRPPALSFLSQTHVLPQRKLHFVVASKNTS